MDKVIYIQQILTISVSLILVPVFTIIGTSINMKKYRKEVDKERAEVIRNAQREKDDLESRLKTLENTTETTKTLVLEVKKMKDDIKNIKDEQCKIKDKVKSFDDELNQIKSFVMLQCEAHMEILPDTSTAKRKMKQALYSPNRI